MQNTEFDADFGSGKTVKNSGRERKRGCKKKQPQAVLNVPFSERCRNAAESHKHDGG